MAKPQADGLDHTIAFLAKREGIDKVRDGNCHRCVHERSDVHAHTHHERYIHAAFPALLPQTLKIIRYASRLVVALSPPDSERRARFDALQSSVGTSRQAGPC